MIFEFLKKVRVWYHKKHRRSDAFSQACLQQLRLCREALSTIGRSLSSLASAHYFTSCPVTEYVLFPHRI